jgi:hypothetical protein
MEIIFANFGKALVLTIWIVCGIIGAISKNWLALIPAAIATSFYFYG